jgi:predicted O-methyltransferase YrrM
MLNITRDTGQLLLMLVQVAGAQRVLEIGTSNGYSTLWLAESAKAIGGTVTTIEFDKDKTDLASVNFTRAGLSPFITQIQYDAGRFLEETDENTFDLIFLDSDRAAYVRWWIHLRRILRLRGLLIVDNATSHIDQIAPLVTLATADSKFASCLLPIGKGQFLIVKTSA